MIIKTLVLLQSLEIFFIYTLKIISNIFSLLENYQLLKFKIKLVIIFGGFLIAGFKTKTTAY